MPPEGGAPAAGRRWHWWLGTAGGLGRAPLAPGTFASAATLALAWPLAQWGGPLWLVGATVLAFALGLWAAQRLARELDERDPSVVVADEVCGQLAALWFLPPRWGVLCASFFLFRAFDILKPPPARLAERLPGGLGIMLDDLVAAAYANAALHLALYLWG